MNVSFSARQFERRRVLGLSLVALSATGLWCEGAARADSADRSFATGPAARAPRLASRLRFEANAGQLADEVRFLARGSGFGLYLTRDGATLALRRSPRSKQVSVSMRLADGRAVEPVGTAELAERSNYFVGSDAARWRSGVPSYARVRYPEVRPGVDVLYYASQAEELEYDLELRAGVDASALQLELEGITSLDLAPNGDALLGLSDGSVLRQRRPVAHQLDAQGRRNLVAVRFVKRSERRLGFAVGAHDLARPLVIDPTISYSTYLGGSKFDEFSSVAADSAGNTYAVGYTTGTLFPTHAASQVAYGGGASDAVVCKLKADGTGFVYSTYLGGGDADRAYGVAVDASGSAYVTGLTFSTNFPTVGALQAAAGGGQDAFVTKLGPSGALVYSTYLGGSADDLAQGIALRGTGEAYVVGTTFSANFPRVSAFQSTLGGTNDAFVSRLSAAGSALTYSTYLGGTGAEYGQAISVSSDGSAVVVGQTGSSNFPTFAAVQPSFGGAVSDAFVTRLNPAGSSLVYSTYLGGASPDVATGVALAGAAAIVVGYTSSFNFPVLNPGQATLAGNSDAFVTRIGSGGALDFSSYWGGTAADSASAVAVDQNNFAYVVGQTASSNFPIETPIAGQASLQGASDAFLIGLAGGSGARLYSTYLGGNAADGGVSVAVGGPATLQVLGNTFSTSFPMVGVPLFNSPPGPQDGFVTKLATLSLSPAPASRPLTLLLLALLLLGSGLAATSRRRAAA